jgi:anti-sigma factor RsiW
MDCRRAEELLSDHVEGALEEPLRSELERHLTSCPACRELREALGDVIAALKSHPVLDAPAGLAERAAEAALRRPAPLAGPAFAWRFRTVPWRVQVAAAALAMAVTGVVLAASGAENARRLPMRVRERAVNTGVYIAERKDRLVENFRILRVVVGTAFGSRVDRLGDRVEDYRKLLEQRKSSSPEPKKTNGSRAEEDEARVAAALRLPNIEDARFVTSVV